ncbi:hypothetical protein [Actinomadura sp. 6N118]|uniref:hypothetical protein n=1 Tax=Actinomadura sp. 6N118 TaxID=3375151 RepID=UPI0037A1C96C
MSTAQSFFLAGVMQGARSGAAYADQGYRGALRTEIARYRPDAVVHDPFDLMRDWIGAQEQLIRREHAELADRPIVQRDKAGPGLTALIDTFHRLARTAAASDVCVAWLPEHEPSMGTAVEMHSACLADRTVVAITQMRQNLAVLACTSVILPDLEAFGDWLAHGGDRR